MVYMGPHNTFQHFIITIYHTNTARESVGGGIVTCDSCRLPAANFLEHLISSPQSSPSQLTINKKTTKISETSHLENA